MSTTTTTRATLARLEAHLERHPEIRDRAARWFAGACERINARERRWFDAAARRIEAAERTTQGGNTRGGNTTHKAPTRRAKGDRQ